MKIEQKFHDYCDGCQFLDVQQCENGLRLSDGAIIVSRNLITCNNYELCAQLLNRLSTIRNDPPDLMEQIATICRRKGISVETAVELFRNM